MKRLLQLPLLAKVLIWLCLHVLLFGACFLLFVNWQLGMGLDSLLSGSAGKRLTAFGDEVVEKLVDMEQDDWGREVGKMAANHHLNGFLVFTQADLEQRGVPESVIERISGVLPPRPPAGRGPRAQGPGQNPQGPATQPNPSPRGPSHFQGPNAQQGPGGGRPYPPPHMRGPGMGPRGGPGGPQGGPQGGPGGFRGGPGTQGPNAGPGDNRFRSHPADVRPGGPGAPQTGQPQGDTRPNSVRAGNMFSPDTSAEFLMRCEDGGGYWAGVIIHFPPLANMPMHPVMLLVRSDSLDGDGMFFDFKPWLWGALAVLIFSLLFWTPFVWNISSYLKKLTAAAGEIAGGRFQVAIPSRGRDELGELGDSIDSMSKRLDHMVSSQKRFLADAAHELCGPLARVRTGIGILEARMEGADAASLQSIEADVEELAGLVDEVLSFSRAGHRKVLRKQVKLREVADEAIHREALPCKVINEVPDALSLITDPSLVSRAIGNLIRNASIHVGTEVTVTIRGEEKGGMMHLFVEDDGPGVPAEELEHLFQPFYRLDKSRSRDSGGSGLGLAIVRTSIHACSGEVKAYEAPGGGFGVHLRLPKTPPAEEA